ASDVAEVLSRAKSLGERIRGQLNVVGERRTRLDGELQNAVDDGLVANLEAESARITAELAIASAELDAMRPEFAELETSEADLTNEQLSFDSQWGDSMAPTPSRAAELRAQIEALGTTSDRNEQALERLSSRIEAIDQRVANATETHERAVALLADQEPRLPELEAALATADDAVERTESELTTVSEDRRRLDAEASHWQARAEALAQALDEARVKAGAEALASEAGVLGTLLDLIDIDEGWEAAVEAAIGDALAAVVVDGPGAARQALSTLEQNDLTGAVIALGLDGPRTAPAGVNGPVGSATVRSHVRPLRPDVGPLLDALLGDAVVLPGRWQDSIDTILANPDTVFVTNEGDRFGRRGWRLRQGTAGATGAALDEARAQEERSAEAAARRGQLVADARDAQREALAERKRLEGQLQHTRNEIERATMTRDRAVTELASFADDRQQLVDERAGVFHRKQADATELRSLMDELPSVENEEAEQRNRVEALRQSRTTLEERAKEVSTRRTELEVKIASLESRRELLRTRQTETESRLERLVSEREQARVRRVRIERSLAAVGDLADRLEGHQGVVAEWIGLLETEQHAQSEAARRVAADLSTKRGERAAAEKELTELRERRSRLELSETEYRVKLEALVDAVRRELDTDPETAMATPCPELPAGATPEARVRDLERELKIMGAINPLALEEFEELKERYEFLQGQLDDVKSTRRDLHKLIRSIDDEIVGVFSAAYADVSTNFVDLFQNVFPGGKGELKLLNSEDILNCGIEIEAKPSGKNVKKLSLLSGGERS
ncbi:MAG: hypothetical protein AAFO29_11690, partial [Actinomycetota bacterium]